MKLVIIFYLTASIGIATSGIIMSGSDECKKPRIRAEYLFPAFRLGCWLGEVP